MGKILNLGYLKNRKQSKTDFNRRFFIKASALLGISIILPISHKPKRAEANPGFWVAVLGLIATTIIGYLALKKMQQLLEDHYEKFDTIQGSMVKVTILDSDCINCGLCEHVSFEEDYSSAKDAWQACPVAAIIVEVDGTDAYEEYFIY